MVTQNFWLITTESQQKLAEWDKNMAYDLPMRRQSLKLILKKSSIQDDFIWTWYNDLLITKKVKQIFNQEKVKGYILKDIDSIKIKNETKKKIQLWELQIVGWAGQALAESGIKLDKYDRKKEETRYTKLVNLDFLIDYRKWDGSDFFIVWPIPKFIFVTDKVKKIIDKYKLAGAKLIKPKQFTKKLFLEQTNFSPGTPKHWFPNELALHRSKELGIED